MKTYKSNTKPRYDNAGTEFGDMHRELPKQFGLFDVDRMTAKAVVDLELTRANEAFIEYRTNWNNGDEEIEWKVLYEIKYKNGYAAQKAMEIKKGTSTWAQIKMAEQLGMRYIFVIATNGKQPFTFYEYEQNAWEKIGILDYTDENKTENVKKFWYYTLNIR